MLTMSRKKSFIVICFSTALLATGTAAMAQQTPPTEEQCQQMVNGMIQALKSAQLETERDKKDASALIERTENILKDNRARGGSECESWAEIAKMATRQ